jgi:hypothetical protein
MDKPSARLYDGRWVALDSEDWRRDCLARAFLSWTFAQQEHHCNQMRKFGRDAALAQLLADVAAMRSTP